MRDIVSVKLENEMDLVLAHKRAMKISELTGSSLIVQTSFATGVSEIARCAIDYGKNAAINFGIDSEKGRKVLKAVVHDSVDFSTKCVEACEFARRLVHEVEVNRTIRGLQIILKNQLGFAGTLTEARLESFVEYFKSEPPLSPYDEIRRKNLLLQDLADQLRASDSNYKALTDTLPLMMFSAQNTGAITFANKWLIDFLGATPKELSGLSWQNFIHPQDFGKFKKDLETLILKRESLNGQYRFRNSASGFYVVHLVSIVTLKNDKDIPSGWMGFLVDIHAQKIAEQTLKDNLDLKDTQGKLYRIQEELESRIVDLNRSNYELEQFAHLASHDLQEPLRKIFFYSDALKTKYSAGIDGRAREMIFQMTTAASRMRQLISDLLSYSQLQQPRLAFEKVDLNIVMDEIVRDFEVVIREKAAILEVAPLPTLIGNELRLRQLFSNLISNSLKYSRKEVAPIIQINTWSGDDDVIIELKDNGIGFDEAYCEKIFGLFERLHSRDQFPGTGIGLSICKRIVELHGGSITATSRPDEFAMFRIVLPLHQTELEYAVE